MIRLYHGSNMKIEVPDLVHSKPFKDFGSGFYLSPDKQQAWDITFQYFFGSERALQQLKRL